MSIVRRSAKRILAMIAISWTMSAVISVPPLFGLKHSADYLSSLEEASSLTLPSAADFAWNSSTVMAASTFFHASSSSVEGRSVLDADFEYENARTLPSKVWNDRHPVVEHHLLISLFRTFFRREPSTAVDGDGVALAAAETSSCDFINGARTKRFIDAVYQSSVNASDDGISPSPIFECVISQDIGYTVFSTVGAFYLPLAFITAVYLNVYRVARSRIHRKQFNNRKQQYHRGGGGGGPAVDADVDQPSGRVDLSSSLERDMGSNLLRVFGGLRARLSTGSTSSVQPATSGAGFGQSPTIDRRAASFNNGNFPLGHHHHHHLSTATATGRSTTADRANATNTSGIYQNYLHPQASPTHQQQQQQQLMVNQSTPRQYLSVDVSPRLSESSSPPSTPSSRGGSWIYLTRFCNASVFEHSHLLLDDFCSQVPFKSLSRFCLHCPH
jgi:hypothetical protein